jgi:hypothetical protein
MGWACGERQGRGSVWACHPQRLWCLAVACVQGPHSVSSSTASTTIPPYVSHPVPQFLPMSPGTLPTVWLSPFLSLSVVIEATCVSTPCLRVRIAWQPRGSAQHTRRVGGSQTPMHRIQHPLHLPLRLSFSKRPLQAGHRAPSTVGTINKLPGSRPSQALGTYTPRSPPPAAAT